MSTSSPTPRASASADEKAEFRQEPQNPLTDSKPSSEHDLEKDGGEVQPVPTKKSIRDDSDHEWITGIKLFLVMAGMTLACFLMLLDTSIITTAIPRITSDFNSLRDVGWYGSSYLLANCAIQPLTGKIYSHYSSKIVFLCFLGTFELGSVICGAATSSIMLIIGRVIAGMGASGIINGALTIISCVVPLHKRPAMMGALMGCGQMGLVVGPLIGGAFTQYVSWRWCFYINLPIGGLAMLLIFIIHIPDRVERGPNRLSNRKILGQLDFFGFFLFAPFAVMLLLALQWGGINYPWNSPTIIGLFCGSAGMLLLFGAWEYHVGEGAMIPFFMVRQRIIISSCLTMACFFGSLLAVTFYLPIYFQSIKGVTPGLSGVYILPSILSMMLMAVTSGILVGKLGYYLPWIIVSGAIQLIGMGLMTTFKVDTPAHTWIGYQIIGGLGRGLGMQMPIVAVQNCLKPSTIPVGMSILVFSQTFGGAIFLAIAQLIFSHGLLNGLHAYAPTVNAEVVVNAGATAVRSVVSLADLPGVLQAYMSAIDKVFYLSTGAAGGVFLFSWGMGWKSIKKAKKPVDVEAKPVGAEAVGEPGATGLAGETTV